jgi:hypothetical protein
MIISVTLTNDIDLTYCTPFLSSERYEYRTADTFLKDFALMKTNAIKFNGTFFCRLP